MTSIVELKNNRLEEVEANSRKLIDQNITITSENTALKV